jgi:1-acyl-sn-glycerol-3-phosphate acyltransferase
LKLLAKPGDRIRVLNAPAGYVASLSPLPDGTSIVASGDGDCDVVQLFARDRAELERDAAVALHSVKAGGVLWMSYPSPASDMTSDLSRDHGWGVLNAMDLVATTHVSLSHEWDALRFQPTGEVPHAAIPAADMLPVGRRASTTFRVVRLAATALFHALFRFDVEGRSRIPNAAFVVIANHLGWMDAVSLLVVFPAEPRIHFLADPTSMMRNRWLWALVRRTGGIVSVDRARRGDKALFKHVFRCLEQGGVVALFPEGDFGPREGALLPFKKGFAHFAVEAGVPVLPVALSGTKEVWLRKRLVMRIGEPIPTAGRTVDEIHDLGERGVRELMPGYVEHEGPKRLRRWLTGLF